MRKFDDLKRILGIELLSQLCGIPSGKLGIFESVGDILKILPEQEYTKIVFISIVASTLLNTRNEDDVRGWFHLKRVELQNRSPVEILRGDWSIEDENVKNILKIAMSG